MAKGPGIIEHKMHQWCISPNSVDQEFLLSDHLHSFPFFPILLLKKSSSFHRMSQQGVQTLFHCSVRVTITFLLHWKSNLKVESVLDFRSRNLWYIDLENSSLSLAFKIGTQRGFSSKKTTGLCFIHFF